MNLADDIKALLVAAGEYDSRAPEKLRELDEIRYRVIPTALAARTDAHITKDEALDLTRWKVYACAHFRSSWRFD